MNIKPHIRKLIIVSLSTFRQVVSHRYFLNIKKKNKIKTSSSNVKKAWLDKWSVLGRIDPVYYDVYSHFTGDSTDIVPDSICHNVIEPILNPIHSEGYYSDKNNFDKLLPSKTLPVTVLRKISGAYLDPEYNYIQVDENNFFEILNGCGFKELIIKPTVKSSSGKGVMKIVKHEDGWFDVSKKILISFSYVDSLGTDIIVQEALTQSEFMSHFNDTSVNTIRLSIYRSVITNECHVVGAIMRIRKKGSYLDNIHAGGQAVSINETGVLGNCAIDQYGQKTRIFNNIDFAETFRINNYEKIVEFGKSVASRVLNARLLALDITIDKNEEPRLIEFNIGGYGVWVFQFAGQPAFGNYSNEIIDYCLEHQNNNPLSKCVQKGIYFRL